MPGETVCRQKRFTALDSNLIWSWTQHIPASPCVPVDGRPRQTENFTTPANVQSRCEKPSNLSVSPTSVSAPRSNIGTTLVPCLRSVGSGSGCGSGHHATQRACHLSIVIRPWFGGTTMTPTTGRPSGGRGRLWHPIVPSDRGKTVQLFRQSNAWKRPVAVIRSDQPSTRIAAVADIR